MQNLLSTRPRLINCIQPHRGHSRDREVRTTSSRCVRWGITLISDIRSRVIFQERRRALCYIWHRGIREAEANRRAL
jgi:hypothetical protein